jgi:phasin family protein
MFSNTDQFSSATKATIESNLATMNELTSKALNNFAELMELNLATAKLSLEQSAAAAHQILSAKDAQEIFSVTSAHAQPNAEKAMAYGRQLASIASKTQSEFTKAAEVRVAETSHQVTSLIDELTKTAPAGSENAVAMMKAAISNANASYEQFSKAAKQAGVALEDNINQAAKHFAPANEKPAKAKK